MRTGKAEEPSQTSAENPTPLRAKHLKKSLNRLVGNVISQRERINEETCRISLLLAPYKNLFGENGSYRNHVGTEPTHIIFEFVRPQKGTLHLDGQVAHL